MSVFIGCKSIMDASGNASSVVNTSWTLHYVSPTYGAIKYKVKFKENNRLVNKHPNDKTYDNDFWYQSGINIKMQFNNSYVTYNGEIVDNNLMKGTAINKKGETWSWTLTR